MDPQSRQDIQRNGLFHVQSGRARLVDLRSDVVTRPSPEMKEFMARARVGNDGWGEDPTVNELQERFATALGKEAALFVPSGTMGNQLAIRTLAPRGSEVIVDRDSHIFNYEAAAASTLAGVQLLPLTGEKGILSADQVLAAIRPVAAQFPQTSLICLENTHNRGGGVIYPLNKITAMAEVAKKRGIKMHLDGARLFNASVASGTPASAYAKHFDTVMSCLSKGLGCPIGSLLVGDQKTIATARRHRRMYGGSMRQAGIVAAAGIFALDHNVKRLQEDHEHAKLLSQALLAVDELDVWQPVETNMVCIDVSRSRFSPDTLVEALACEGVLIAPYNPPFLRMVTHLDVSREDILFTIEVFQELFR